MGKNTLKRSGGGSRGVKMCSRNAARTVYLTDSDHNGFCGRGFYTVETYDKRQTCRIHQSTNYHNQYLIRVNAVNVRTRQKDRHQGASITHPTVCPGTEVSVSVCPGFHGDVIASLASEQILQ